MKIHFDLQFLSYVLAITYLFIGATEVIHVSTVKLAFSVLLFLIKIKNKLFNYFVFIGTNEVFQVSSL